MLSFQGSICRLTRWKHAHLFVAARKFDLDAATERVQFTLLNVTAALAPFLLRIWRADRRKKMNRDWLGRIVRGGTETTSMLGRIPIRYDAELTNQDTTDEQDKVLLLALSWGVLTGMLAGLVSPIRIISRENGVPRSGWPQDDRLRYDDTSQGPAAMTRTAATDSSPNLLVRTSIWTGCRSGWPK